MHSNCTSAISGYLTRLQQCFAPRNDVMIHTKINYIRKKYVLKSY
ncbi:hypothetical protein [Rickettsia felis]|nr:hypothetical protein [Rickettsia felis]